MRSERQATRIGLRPASMQQTKFTVGFLSAFSRRTKMKANNFAAIAILDWWSPVIDAYKVKATMRERLKRARSPTCSDINKGSSRLIFVETKIKSVL